MIKGAYGKILTAGINGISNDQVLDFKMRI